MKNEPLLQRQDPLLHYIEFAGAFLAIGAVASRTRLTAGILSGVFGLGAKGSGS